MWTDRIPFSEKKTLCQRTDVARHVAMEETIDPFFLHLLSLSPHIALQTFTVLPCNIGSLQLLLVCTFSSVLQVEGRPDH